MSETRILVGIGANLASARFGAPRDTVEAALAALARAGIAVTARSRWFESAPVPLSDQPWYVNGVAVVASRLAPRDLLDRLHAIEAEFGRVRVERNEARMLDLDLLAYGALVEVEEGGLVLPHPRLAERAFVLLPLADVAPDWRHPVTGLAIPDLLANLPRARPFGPWREAAGRHGAAIGRNCRKTALFGRCFGCKLRRQALYLGQAFASDPVRI